MTEVNRMLHKGFSDFRSRAEDQQAITQQTTSYRELLKTAAGSYLSALEIRPDMSMSTYVDFIRTQHAIQSRDQVIDDMIDTVRELLDSGQAHLPDAVLALVESGEIELPYLNASASTPTP